MPGEVRHVAVPVRETPAVRILTSDERIVGRNAAIVADAQDLADVAVQVLREDRHARVVRGVVPDVIVERQIDHAVRPERSAARDRPALNPGVGLEDLLHVDERRAVEPRPCERERRHRLRAS